MNFRRLAITALFAAAMLSGCAETPMVMSFNTPAQENPKVWPAPPDEPRFRYVGELTGEDNFHPVDWANRSTATQFFEWLVGLTSGNKKPVMLQRPQAGAVDAEGRVYITDVGRAGIYAFDKRAGKLNIWEMSGEDERFVAPIGIVPGREGEILVADAELHSVFRLDSNGLPIGEFGRDILKRPTGLARDVQQGLVYVADTHAHDIKVFTDEGVLVRTLGRRGEGDGEFNFPTHLAFSKDRLYVTDTMNSRIQVFDTNGSMLKKFGERGLFVGNLVRPKGVAVDSAGNIYVIESLHDRLLVFDGEGHILLAVGGTGKSTGNFYLPAGIWIDQQDRIYIADTFNGRITILQYLGSVHEQHD